MKTKIKNLVILGLLFTIFNVTDVFAGWMTIKGNPGNAGNVCGYYRPGTSRDCQVIADYGLSVPVGNGYRLDFANASINQGCYASTSGLTGRFSCYAYGTIGSTKSVSGTASARSTDTSAPWAISRADAATGYGSCHFNGTVDTSPPDCGTITINGRSGGWFKAGSYTASMTAYDSQVGINGCGKTGNFSSGISSGGGRASVTLFPKDMFGNTRSCTAYFDFDGTAPSCSATYTNNGWTNQNVYVQGHCSDGQSGCAGSPNGTATYEDQWMTLTCRDNVGNTRNTSTQVTNIDKTPPSCGSVSSTRPNGGGWTREPIPVNVGCWDAKSGCTQGSYTQMIGGGWGNIGIADNATNTNGCDVSYDFWDGTAPSIQIKLDDAHNINSIEYQTSDDQVTVSISAADSQSGVDRTCYELSGATTKAPQCFAGSRIPDFNLTNDGKTIVHAWAFDKAYNYNNGYYYDKDTGGNRADASRDVYFDRVKPNATEELQKAAWLQSMNYDVTDTSNTNWTNVPPLVQANTEDTPINKGTSYESRSGMGTLEWVWSLTDDPTKIWGKVDENRIYTESNADGDVVPIQTMKGVYRIPQVLATRQNIWKPQNSLPSSPELNDTVYLHARACDRAVGNYSHKQPNCSTAVIGAFKFDDIPPTLDDILAKDNVGNDLSEHDWTNKFKVEVSGKEAEPIRDESHPLGPTLRDTSGLDQIQLYYDNNNPHPATLTKELSTYTNVIDNFKVCNSAKACAYKIDFNNLLNDPSNKPSTVMVEGTRYIKARVKDVAGNFTDKIFGPYRFDITGPEVTGDIEISGEDGYFIPKG